MVHGEGKRRAVCRFRVAAAALADSGLSATDRARLAWAVRDLYIARWRDVAMWPMPLGAWTGE